MQQLPPLPPFSLKITKKNRFNGPHTPSTPLGLKHKVLRILCLNIKIAITTEWVLFYRQASQMSFDPYYIFRYKSWDGFKHFYVLSNTEPLDVRGVVTNE